MYFARLFAEQEREAKSSPRASLITSSEVPVGTGNAVPIADISLSYSLNGLSLLLLKDSYLQLQHLRETLSITGCFMLIGRENGYILALPTDLSHSGK